MTTMVARPPCDAGAVLGAPAAPPCTPATGRWVLAATVLGSSMVFIDSSAVNVVLPVLQDALGASITQMQWVVEIYLLLLAACMLVGGALGDRLGRRRVFVWGVALFAFASLWCGLAPDPVQLIVARALQGVGGALLVPGSLAIISASFDESTRGRAFGTWSGLTAITMAAGPVLGGWLATAFSWRWVFFLNLPFAAAVILISATRVPESRELSATGPIDWAGAALSAAGLGLLVFGLVESPNLGWTHPLAGGTVAAGLLLLAAFVRAEARTPAPMMPLDLFASRAFAGANLLTFLLYGALGGVLFFLPFSLIQVHGYTPTQAGAAWLPFILCIAVLSRWAGALVPVVGARALLVCGPFVTALGFALAARPGTTGNYWTTFFPAFLTMGIGMAIAVAPLVTVVMGSVPPGRAGIASGVNNAVSRAAGLVALAVMGVIVVAVFDVAVDRRLADLDIRPEIVERFAAERGNLAGARPPPGATAEEAAGLERVVRESFTVAFQLVMALAAVLAAAGTLVAWRTIGGPTTASGEVTRVGPAPVNRPAWRDERAPPRHRGHPARRCRSGSRARRAAPRRS